MEIEGTWLIGPNEPTEQADHIHSWVGGMCYVHPEDLDTVARERAAQGLKPVECESCEQTYEPMPETPAVQATTYKGKTAAQWHRMAGENHEYAKKYQLYASLADSGGIWEFPALFTLTGALVPGAVYIKSRKLNKWLWRIGNTDPVSWFTPSAALSGARRRANDMAKGYQVGSIRARAQVAPGLSATGLVYYYITRVDGSPIEIIDNGSLGTAYQDR